MLNAILQLESQGECRDSATEDVLMVGYPSDGISNQEQIRWLSWNVDGGVRGLDLARNPGLSITTEYGAGEFPLPTKPPTGTDTQSTSKPLSMIRSEQTEESYPDLSNLKRELERAQRKRDQANLKRDQANLDRDQQILSGTKRFLIWIVESGTGTSPEIAKRMANCDHIKSEIERLQRKQQEIAVAKKGR